MRYNALERWRALALSDSTSTFFQTPAWHQLAAPFCGAMPDPVVLDIEGVTAILPVSRKVSAFWSCLLSPHGTYAAPLSSAPLSSTGIAFLNQWMARHSVEWQGSPYSWNNLSPQGCVAWQSHATTLTESHRSRPEAGWSQDMGRRLRRAEEKGLVAIRGGDDAAWQAYYGLYQETLRRWGRRARRMYSLSWFQSLQRECRRNPNMQLIVVHAPGPNPRPVAGMLCFHHQRIASAWQLVSGNKGEDRLGIPVALRFALRDAVENGCDLMDWGPSPDLPGVTRFKTSLGATPRPYAILTRRTPGYRMAAWARRLALAGMATVDKESPASGTV